jgi:hypothetical protein
MKKENKKLIGQLISIKFTDRKEQVSGYVIDYNDDWTLFKYNPVDYIIDGYLILRHKNIEGYRRSKKEKWTEKIINLKGLKPKTKENMPLANLETILTYLTKKHGIFQAYTKSETVTYLCQLKSISEKELVLYNLNSNGKWKGQLKFKPSEIRLIQFDNDYINSMKLLF